MASRTDFLPTADCDCCFRMGMCSKIANHDIRSYPSMVQVSRFQTSEFSAFTRFKKQDATKSSTTAGSTLDDPASVAPISTFQTSESSSLARFRKGDPQRPSNTPCSTPDDPKSKAWTPRFNWQDIEKDGWQNPALNSKLASQSTSGMVEEASKSERQTAAVVGRKKASGDKKQMCHICGKLYARLSTLRIHMRIHLGVKPYRCPYCPKAFTQSGNRATHMRTHTGAKPYVCTRCGKRFAHSSALKSHKLTHQEITPVN